MRCQILLLLSEINAFFSTLTLNVHKKSLQQKEKDFLEGKYYRDDRYSKTNILNYKYHNNLNLYITHLVNNQYDLC